jgi:hypothetical protein
VENTAAGTLKITLMIWLRFRSMKTVAMRLARKLPKAIRGMENKDKDKTYAIMKKMRPSAKIIWVRRLCPNNRRVSLSQFNPTSLYVFKRSTIRSKHME